MMPYVVRHNQATHRVITGCPCGQTVNFPDSGLATFHCKCGRIWEKKDRGLAVHEPTSWRRAREAKH